MNQTIVETLADAIFLVPPFSQGNLEDGARAIESLSGKFWPKGAFYFAGAVSAATIIAGTLLTATAWGRAETLEGNWALSTDQGHKGTLYIAGKLPRSIRAALRFPSETGGAYMGDFYTGSAEKGETGHRCMVVEGAAISFMCSPHADEAGWLPANFFMLLEHGSLTGSFGEVAAAAVFSRQDQDPQASMGAVATGRAARESGDLEEAERLFTRAIALDLKNALAYHERGSLNRWTKRYDFALADLNEAIELQPKGSAHFMFRGNVYYEVSRYEGAIADYSEAIRLQPNYPTFHYWRCLAHDKLGNRSNAIADCRKVLQISPDHERAREQLERMAN